MIKEDLSIYVLYHAHCTDGTGSKFAAWKKFGKTAEYIPVSYGKAPPEMKPNSEVYILDFSYDKKTLETLQLNHNKVVVLDHPKTAQEALAGVPGCVFDMTKSGCVLSWEYFHPNTKIPNLLLDIQDRDLWKFERPNSKMVHAGLKLAEGKMETWDFYIASEEMGYRYLVNNGKILLDNQNIEIQKTLKGNNVQYVKVGSYNVGMINTTENISELGNEICKLENPKVNYSICYYIDGNQDVKLSFRSIGDFDVSEITKMYGGGGHKNASGATCDLRYLQGLLRNKMRL